MFGFLGDITSGIVNASMQAQANAMNQKNYDLQRDDYRQNNQVSNLLLGHFDNDFKTDVLDKVPSPAALSYDYLNPYLSLSSNKLQKQSMALNEEQFKYSKYVTENSAQIKAKDYEKAGFSPLLAVGGNASYSPVSTGSSGATGSKSQFFQGNPVINQAAKIQFGTGIARELAEIDVLRAQKNKINAETSTELNRPANISADTKLKENQSIKVNEETSFIKEQINSELLKQGLTKKQVDYYDTQIATLQHNLEESKKNGIRTTDQMPFVFSEIQNILQAMGVNPDSNLGQFLTAGTYALLMYSGARVKAPTVNNYNNKFNNNTTNFIKK